MNQGEIVESASPPERQPDDVNFISESELSVNSILVKNSSAQNENFHVLNWKQVKRLDDLLNSHVPIHGRGNFPTLNIKLKDFIRNLRKRLTQQRVRIRDIRINGGVASNILAEEHDYEFSDIDIVYSCDLLQLDSLETPQEQEQDQATAASRSAHFTNNLEFSFSYCCDIIKQTVLECLLDYFPYPSQTESVSWQHLKEAYVKKMTKIYQASTSASSPCPTDDSNLSSSSSSSSDLIATATTSRWSLISFCNDQGKNIELKFVDQMKRQFQFSVDSFQIHLDSLLRYYDCQDSLKQHNVPTLSYTSRSMPYEPSQINNSDNQNQFSSNFFPSVLAESKYGNFAESLHHLNTKLIATRCPEEIRGGGLLKYCNLLIRGYTSVCDEKQMASIERYMCSRFFIDFSDLKDQEYKLNTYLDSHFQNDSYMCGVYLKRLFQIVNTSTVCLMGHERKQTLNLIESMARQFDGKFKSDRGVTLNAEKQSFCSLDSSKKPNNNNYKAKEQRHKKKPNYPASNLNQSNNGHHNTNKSHHMNQNQFQRHYHNSSVPSIKLEYLTNSDISLRSSISSSASLSASTSPSLSVSHSPSHSPIQSPSPSPSPASSTANSRIPSPLDQKNKVNYSSFLKNNTTSTTNSSSSSSSSCCSTTSSSSCSQTSTSSSSSSEQEQKLISSSKTNKHTREIPNDMTKSSLSPPRTTSSHNVYQCKLSPNLFSHLEVFNNFFCPPYFPELVMPKNNFNQQVTSTWVVSPTK